MSQALLVEKELITDNNFLLVRQAFSISATQPQRHITPDFYDEPSVFEFETKEGILLQSGPANQNGVMSNGIIRVTFKPQRILISLSFINSDFL
jgi:hypothetical protein